MNKVGAVILSRFNSTRLPGKALTQIEGKEVLQYIVERLNVVLPISDIVIATSEERSDDPIADFAANRGYQCFRGSLDNVAERFYQAGTFFNFDYATRINGDNIFVDTEVFQTMLNQVNGGFDFITNVHKRTYPKGMSIEIVRLEAYAAALDEMSQDPKYFEHVTSLWYEKPPKNVFYQYNIEVPEAAGIQFALDTPDDLARSTEIIRKFEKIHTAYHLKEIFELQNHL